MQALNKLIVAVFFCGVIWHFIGLEPSSQGYRLGSVQTMIIFFLVVFVALTVRGVRALERKNRSRKNLSRINHRTYRRNYR